MAANSGHALGRTSATPRRKRGSQHGTLRCMFQKTGTPSPSGRAATGKQKHTLFRACFAWRGGRDSNPRPVLPGTHLAGEPIQPLWHLPISIDDFRLTIFDWQSSIAWRREWDSNPRWCDPNMFSRHAPSAARPSLRKIPSVLRQRMRFYHNQPAAGGIFGASCGRNHLTNKPPSEYYSARLSGR